MFVCKDEAFLTQDKESPVHLYSVMHTLIWKVCQRGAFMCYCVNRTHSQGVWMPKLVVCPPLYNILTTIRCILMIFGTCIHDNQRINPTHFGAPLTFSLAPPQDELSYL